MTPTNARSLEIVKDQVNSQGELTDRNFIHMAATD